jgi:hypothetical protein
MDGYRFRLRACVSADKSFNPSLVRLDQSGVDLRHASRQNSGAGKAFLARCFLFIGRHMIPLKYLHILRTIAIAAFAAGAIWLAEWHHTDATVVDALAVIIPFIVVTFTNVMIKRDK